MRLRASYAALGFVLLATIASASGAQDTTGVRLGLTYAAGTKPGVIVLPVRDDYDDSLRVIVQRDFDYSDRLTPIDLDNITLSGLVPRGSGAVDYPLVAKFGASLLVHMEPVAGGLQVSAYDVAGKKLLQSEHFLFDPRDRDWRFALHGISDQVEKWVFGKRGIAQTRIAYIANGTLRIVDSDGAVTRTGPPGAARFLRRGRRRVNPSSSPFSATTARRCSSSMCAPVGRRESARSRPDSTSRRSTSRTATGSFTRREQATAPT